MTCLCSAPQYQAEGRERIWDLRHLREHEGHRVRRELLFHKMHSMGIPLVYIKSVMALYDDIKAAVRQSNGDSFALFTDNIWDAYGPRIIWGLSPYNI